jgi:hypothetical protein
MKSGVRRAFTTERAMPRTIKWWTWNFSDLRDAALSSMVAVATSTLASLFQRSIESVPPDTRRFDFGKKLSDVNHLLECRFW